MINIAIELHDSEVLAVDVDGEGRGSVLLDAYVHRTESEPGVAPGEGGVQRVRINLETMKIDGEVGDLPAYIYEGSITIGSSIQDNLIPFPASYSESARLSMMLSEDARVVVVSGSQLSIEPEGEFRFVERVDFSHRSS